MKRTLLVATLALMFGVGPMAALGTAAPIELNSGVFFTQAATGESTGRGLGVTMLNDFALTSLGIQADLNLLSFDVQLYGSTNGSDTGALFASATAVLGGTGYQWWDIPLNFDLLAGSSYVLHFRPTVSTTNWLDDGGLGLAYYHDSGLPVDIGAFRLIDGEEGWTPPLNFSNFVHADLRVNGADAAAVPEPATLLLLGGGLVAARVRRYRRRSA